MFGKKMIVASIVASVAMVVSTGLFAASRSVTDNPVHTVHTVHVTLKNARGERFLVGVNDKQGNEFTTTEFDLLLVHGDVVGVYSQDTYEYGRLEVTQHVLNSRQADVEMRVLSY